MAQRVLIVENDRKTSSILIKVIKGIGLCGDIAETGKAALQQIGEKDYALMLLTLDLDDMEGFEVIETMRKHGNLMPIIIISERIGEVDTLYGLDVGADDYVNKPFNPVTLGAKIKALIRRVHGDFSNNEHRITAEPFSYDTQTLRLYKNDQEIILTGKENALMKLFLNNINRVFPKDMLYDMIWGNDIVDDNTVTVYINRLRKKIEDKPEEPKYLQNVRGVGYRLVV